MRSTAEPCRAAVHTSEPGSGTEAVSGNGPTGPRIRCPKCNWSPQAHDVWYCLCGHSWNTFDTGGVCPACLRQWLVTQCLSCKRFSAHSDWYTHE